jgi:hypothetical protein
MKLPQRPENNESENAQVHPRHDQHVVSAGSLKLGARPAFKKRIFAQDHRVQECGLLGRPELMDLGDETSVNVGPPVLDAAPDEAGKNFDIQTVR